MTCPGCGEERLVERVGCWWFCAVCAWRWLAFSKTDAVFLKALKVKV